MNVVMNQTHKVPSLRSPESGAKLVRLSKKGQTTRRGRNRLLSREALDGRTSVAKMFDHLVVAIHRDLGGADRLSAIELALVEAFAGSAVALDSLNTQILVGAEINHAMVAMHAQTVSAMVRVAQKLGTKRQAKPVPTMHEFLAERARVRGETPAESTVSEESGNPNDE
jgi:hypothetical protein